MVHTALTAPGCATDVRDTFRRTRDEVRLAHDLRRAPEFVAGPVCRVIAAGLERAVLTDATTYAWDGPTRTADGLPVAASSIHARLTPDDAAGWKRAN